MEKEVLLVGELFRELFEKYNRMENKKFLYKDIKELTLIEINTIMVIGHESLRSMSEIAKKLGVTFGTPTVTIDRLINKGFVERVRDEADRRQVFVKLSETGSKVYFSVLDLKKRLTEGVFGVITDEERKVMISALSKINNKFDDICKNI